MNISPGTSLPFGAAPVIHFFSLLRCAAIHFNQQIAKSAGRRRQITSQSTEIEFVKIINLIICGHPFRINTVVWKRIEEGLQNFYVVLFDKVQDIVN